MINDLFSVVLNIAVMSIICLHVGTESWKYSNHIKYLLGGQRKFIKVAITESGLSRFVQATGRTSMWPRQGHPWSRIFFRNLVVSISDDQKFLLLL